jgi:hypothetical protein
MNVKDKTSEPPQRRPHWLRLVGLYGAGFIVLFFVEVIWNWRALQLGDNIARSILIATVWTFILGCWEALFMKVAGKN